MADIFLDTLTYYKDEIDAYRVQHNSDMDAKIDTKLDKAEKGSSGGLAVLDTAGEIPAGNLNWAPHGMTGPENISYKVMAPDTTFYMIAAEAVQLNQVGVANGVAPLDINAKVDPIHLPPQKHVNVFVVQTKSAMYALTGIIEGDRCIVTNEPTGTDNGEYVANTDNPTPSDWIQLPSTQLVDSVNGLIGNVQIDSITESADNKTRLDAIDLKLPEYDKFADHERQLNMDTTKLGVNIDDIITTGYYEVNTNLPFGLTSGELRVGYDTQNTSRVIQEYTDLHEAASYRRQWNGVAFTPWQETAQSVFNDDVQLFATNLANTKADIEYVNKTIINTYTGNTPPDDTLGKNGDRYHQYATEAPTTELLAGQSASPYTSTGVFGLFFDPTATGPQYLAINAETREVFFEYGSDGLPATNDIQMEIDGNALFLTIKSQTAVGATLIYTNSYDALVQTITAGTPFRVTSRGLSGSETDYTKAQGHWYITPIYDNTFDHAGAQGVTIQDIGFTQIVRLTTPARAAGKYQITFNVNASYTSTTSSMKFRYSIDGGQQWSPIVWKEPKDVSDTFVLTDTFVYDFGGGVFDCIIQGACESATQTLTANFANIIVDRKS